MKEKENLYLNHYTVIRQAVRVQRQLIYYIKEKYIALEMQRGVSLIKISYQSRV